MSDQSETKSPFTPEQIAEITAYMLHIEKVWTGRAQMQELKPGTKKYQDAQTYFFCGAMSALEALKALQPIPPKWYFSILRGEVIKAD